MFLRTGGSTMDTSRLVILSGTSNLPLAKTVCGKLGVLLMSQVVRFANGEVKPKILVNVRKKEVFIIQPTNAPAEHCAQIPLKFY